MEVLSGKTLLRKYDEIFAANYNKLTTVIACGDEDLVNDIYLKNRRRFQSNDIFTAQTRIEMHLLNYISLSIHNENKTNRKNQKFKFEIDHSVEEILLERHDNEEDEKLYHNQLEYITQKLFEYVKKNYSKEDNYVFTCYYLLNLNSSLA